VWITPVKCGKVFSNVVYDLAGIRADRSADRSS
jgi:hypothetical protein